MPKIGVLVIFDGGDDDLLVSPVTSHAGRSTNDIFLSDWKSSGLRLASVVRLDKLATIDKRIILRALGRVSAADGTRLESQLHLFLDQIKADWQRTKTPAT